MTEAEYLLIMNEYINTSFILVSVLLSIVSAFLLYQDGRLNRGYWETRAALIKSYMTQEFARDIYIRDRASGLLHKGFLAWADEVLDVDEEL